jgi:hypothetical protein
MPAVAFAVSKLLLVQVISDLCWLFASAASNLLLVPPAHFDSSSPVVVGRWMLQLLLGHLHGRTWTQQAQAVIVAVDAPIPNFPQ